ncbi:MAG: hypothetical protein D6725_06980 [Planctomycetota bacterium]|nr:MAG: hypothetical protein D6725_06980 [Planctomycetota bacterium]
MAISTVGKRFATANGSAPTRCSQSLEIPTPEPPFAYFTHVRRLRIDQAEHVRRSRRRSLVEQIGAEGRVLARRTVRQPIAL